MLESRPRRPEHIFHSEITYLPFSHCRSNFVERVDQACCRAGVLHGTLNTRGELSAQQRSSVTGRRTPTGWSAANVVEDKDQQIKHVGLW